jgi:hypothetical protein
MVSVRGTRFKSCFISAPFGADTSVLRQILEEKGIRWHDQTDVRAGGSWLDVVDTAMTRSDFVCVILPTESHRANALTKAGISYRDFRIRLPKPEEGRCFAVFARVFDEYGHAVETKFTISSEDGTVLSEDVRARRRRSTERR